MKPYAITVNDTTYALHCLNDWDAWQFALCATQGQPSNIKVARL